MSDVPKESASHLLPQNSDAEQGLLSSLLQQPHEVMAMCTDRGMTREWFHAPSHQIIWDICCAMLYAKLPLDFITVTKALADQQLLEPAGGAAFITRLFTFIPTAANASYYVSILAEKRALREVIETCHEFKKRAFEDQDEVTTIIEELQAKVLTIANPEATCDNSLRHIKADMFNAIERIEARYKNRGKLDGLPTGFVDLDRMLDGMKDGDVYVFTGRPGMGKSAFAMAVALRLVDIGTGVAYFTPELTRQRFIDRIFASDSEVTAEKVRRGFLAERDFGKLRQTLEKYCNAPLFLDDTGGLTIAKAQTQLRRAVVKHKCRVGIFDYVNLMRATSKQAQGNKALEIGEIMTGLKESAKNLGIPVIVLAQLNRNAEERKDSRPTLADVKESGAIEERGQMVGALWRPAYYCKDTDSRKAMANKLKLSTSGDTWEQDFCNFALLDILKHTNGATGEVKLKFIGEFTRYEDTDEAKNRPLYSTNPQQRQKLLDGSEEETQADE